MRLIRINTSPHDRAKFFKGRTAFRAAGFIGSQVTWEEHRTKQRCTSGQVGILIDLFGLTLKWIAAHRKLARRAGMATIAVTRGVDYIASESNQCAVLASQI